MRNIPVAACLMAASTLVWAQEKVSPQRVPVQSVVTVEARHGGAAPELTRDDFLAYQGRERLRVTEMVPLRGDRAGLELFLLLDDSASTSVGLQLEDLRQFIQSQPATTEIAVGYMHNGTVSIAQNLTAEHRLAAKALRLPMGAIGAMGNPYWSVSDLIKRWPAGAQRRAILLVTDGVDRFGGFGLTSPYVDAAIEDAQRAGVTVYAIYTPGVGHAGHSRWWVLQGQNFLAKTAEETGGEAYYLGFGPPVSFEPYLSEVAERLKHQYLVTLWLMPAEKGSLQPVRFSTEIPNAELVSAQRVFVPGWK